MWDVILGWALSIAGALGLGVLGNLLTPKAVNLWASLSTRYAKSKIIKLVSNYDSYIGATDRQLQYKFMYALFLCLFNIIFLCAVIVISIMPVFGVWLKITHLNEDGALAWVSRDAIEKSYIIHAYFISFAVVLVFCIPAIRQIRKTKDLYHFAFNPEDYRDRLQERLAKIDSRLDLGSLSHENDRIPS